MNPAELYQAKKYDEVSFLDMKKSKGVRMNDKT